MMCRPISLACIACLGHCEHIMPFWFPSLAVNALRFVSMTISQVRRRDGGDGVHAVPQDAGHPGSLRLLLLDAVLLLYRGQATVRDDRPVRPPDVQSHVSILVRAFQLCD